MAGPEDDERRSAELGVQKGRGIEALIKPDISVTKAAPTSDNRTKIRILEGELLDTKVSITAHRKELEGLRKDLTIKLMLNGKVDKTPLLEAEEALSKLVLHKEELQKEIDALRSDESYPGREHETVQIGPGEKRATQSTDLDIRMVRELLAVEGPKPRPGPQERPPGDREYVERLKDELSPKKEAMKLRIEAGLGQIKPTPPPSVQTVAKVQEITDTPVPTSSGSISGPNEPPVFAPSHYQTSVAPKKVRVRMGTFKPLPQAKDKRMYEMIDRTISMMETGDPLSAKEQLLKALTEYPMDDELLYHLGNAFFMLGDLENAELRFRKAVEKNPISYRALNNLGIVLRKKGKREQAIRALNQSLEVNNKYERAWFNLGTIFMEIEPPLLKEAQIFLKRALECDPNYQKARVKLAECDIMLQKAT